MWHQLGLCAASLGIGLAAGLLLGPTSAPARDGHATAPVEAPGDGQGGERQSPALAARDSSQLLRELRTLEATHKRVLGELEAARHALAAMKQVEALPEEARLEVWRAEQLQVLGSARVLPKAASEEGRDLLSASGSGDELAATVSDADMLPFVEARTRAYLELAEKEAGVPLRTEDSQAIVDVMLKRWAELRRWLHEEYRKQVEMATSLSEMQRLTQLRSSKFMEFKSIASSELLGKLRQPGIPEVLLDAVQKLLPW